MDEMLRVEVAVAWPAQQVRVEVELPAGSSVGDAIRASKIEQRFPDLDVRPDRIGIFGRLCQPEREVRDGDRIEIYRPLEMDPREARRLRAETERR